MFPRIPYLPSRVATFLLGTTLLVACGPKCPPETTNDADRQEAKPLATSPCVNNTLTSRSSVYSATQLATAQRQFGEHIKVNVGTNDMPMTNTRIEVPRTELELVTSTIERDENTEVLGIYFHYGLDHDAFTPVIEFMHMNAQKNLELIPGYSYKVGTRIVNGNPVYFLDKIEQEEKDALLRDYLANARIARTDVTTFAPLRRAPASFPDPLAEWYQYPNKLNLLWEQNSTWDHLIVTCISEATCYSEIEALTQNTAEFRHLLALHTATNGRDNLDDDTVVAGDNYVKRAMDLGHLCPPKCK